MVWKRQPAGSGPTVVLQRARNSGFVAPKRAVSPVQVAHQLVVVQIVG